MTRSWSTNRQPIRDQVSSQFSLEFLCVYQSHFIVTLLFLSFLMFISHFRGLGTSLVEGCAGDFRQNAAECERVHPSVHQHASEGIRQSRSRTFAQMPRTTAQCHERSPRLRERPPEISIRQIEHQSIAKLRERPPESDEFLSLTYFQVIFSSF